MTSRITGRSPDRGTEEKTLGRDGLEKESIPEEMRATFRRIPESDVTYSFARSGGPGGQNVNKVNTKAVLTFDVRQCSVLTDEEKERILIDSRKVREGLIVIHCSETRSQLENKQRALEILNEHIRSLLVPKRKRIATKPSKASKERRLASKRERSEVKRSRSERGKLDE